MNTVTEMPTQPVAAGKGVSVKLAVEPLVPEFSFDRLAIVGASGDAVDLKGCYWDCVVEDYKACIIITPRHVFKKTIDYWLGAKADYCKRWDEFCGVMGSLRGRKYMELPEDEWIKMMPEFENDDDFEIPEKLIAKPIRTFYVASFEKHCDMEHG